MLRFLFVLTEKIVKLQINSSVILKLFENMFNSPTLATGNVLSLADKDRINMNGTIHKHTVKYEKT